VSTPQFQNPAGSGLDASLILVGLFILANVIMVSVLALLYRRKRMKLFSVTISVFLMFNVTLLYFSFIVGVFSNLPLLAGAIAAIATVIVAIYGLNKVVSYFSLFVALELGCSFPVLLQTPLNYIVPAFYAIFDLYAIYYGKMGKLVKQVGEGSKDATPVRSRLKGWPEFGLLTVNFPHFEIGMADIAFYTMVPTVALVVVSLMAFVVVMVVVDVGLALSFFIFRNKEVSPGLPIPILLGLAALLIMYFV
jgi:hypothetical protein